ncbi:unnamed protein product [Spirodela intermedia]|uniref:CAF17 C-terminal domain-containing protein n=1 Tax=Spirodela intermedia TaxID=51605 RepID=A0A7I8IF39_SPIIN|nr:unnamed protein product [Spirodela intermedia]CAA6656231.1 unnamed protein product [Spirodela intermedia]
MPRLLPETFPSTWRLAGTALSSFRFAAGGRSSLSRLVHSSFEKLSAEEKGSLEAAGPLACPLRSRSVIRLQGTDVFKFLQGLLTNDVRPLAEPCSPASPASSSAAYSYLPTTNLPLYQPSPVYAAMLTPQGRFLYDLFLYRPSRPGEKLDRAGTGPGPENHDGDHTLFADVDGSLLDELLGCFRKYRLRSKVEIADVTEELTCWQRFGRGLDQGSPEDPEAAEGNTYGWRWFRDPRLLSLGFRGIFPADTIPPLVEADKETSEENYLRWRLERGVAEGSTEIPKGEAIPLEYNLAGLNAISFDKGCYVGQEFVARTHHRGVIRKRLLPFKIVDKTGAEVEKEIASGSDIMDAASDKKAGTVGIVFGSRGMGLLRLEEAFKSPSLTIKGQEGVEVKVIRPGWWPPEWRQ